MKITTQMVKELRDATSAGIMDAKKALEATNGDVDAAIEILKKKGAERAREISVPYLAQIRDAIGIRPLG